MSDMQQSNEQKDMDAAKRRNLAEEKARNMVPPSLFAQTPEEMQRVLHELQVHQIELEMQNDELRTTQTQIEEVRAQYFDLYDQAPVGYCTIDENGMILEVNKTLTTMLGVNNQIMLNAKLSSYIHREDQDIFYMLKMKLFETGKTLPCELRILSKFGDTIWASLQAVALQDTTGMKYIRVTISDFNKQKIAQQKLWETEEQYRLLTTQMQMGLALHEIICDDDGNPIDYKYINVNDKFEEITGLRKKNILGKTALEVCPNVEKVLIEAYGKVALTGKSIQLEDTLAENERYHSTSVYSPRHGQFATIIDDVTERKRAEMELLTKSRDLVILNEDLEKTLAKLVLTNEELVVAKRKAEEANRAKSQFLSNMSHEIRTPMNGFMGMMQILALTTLTKEQSELLRIAKSSSNTLLSVINDILDYSKIEVGMMVMAETPFHLRETVADARNLFLSSALNKNLDIKVSVEPTLPDVWIGDPFRLRQVLSNLIGNSVKYTKKGTILIHVTGSTPEINGSNTLTFTVSDTGIGIDSENIDMLFNRFTQVDSSITRLFGGTGLGLAICKGLVEMMGGRIWVESEIGKGSSFHFTCILHTHPQAVACVEECMNSESLSIDVSDGEERILLVVDDDEINRIIVKEYANMHSWKIIVAENGLDAISLCEKMQFHAILMDIQMPGMDGCSTTEIIRALEMSKGMRTPIIAMTAYAMEGDQEKCLAAGMDDYLKKPLLYADFHKVVEKWLQKKE